MALRDGARHRKLIRGLLRPGHVGGNRKEQVSRASFRENKNVQDSKGDDSHTVNTVEPHK